MKSNDTWEDSERHRLGPYGHSLPDEPEESNGGRRYLWAGLLLAAAVIAAASLLLLYMQGVRP
jgi:hypothetical protein